MAGVSAGDVFIGAPMHGITLRLWRNTFARFFSSPQVAVSPFISTVSGVRVKPALLEDVDLQREQRIPVIPQVIGKDAEELRVMLAALKQQGHVRVDLNAGCPWPMVAKKGRGAGLMRTPERLAELLRVGCEELPGGFSLKIRLGFSAPDELFDLMPLINDAPLCEVAIHARTARQMYEGTVDLDAFAAAAAACRHPVVYNGDIFTLADWQRLKARFPHVTRWMVGRGALADPFLFEELQRGESVVRDPARIVAWSEAYAEASLQETGNAPAALGRLKEMWGYLTGKQGRTWRALRLCRTLDEFRRIATASR